jgi:hypothetical protein
MNRARHSVVEDKRIGGMKMKKNTPSGTRDMIAKTRLKVNRHCAEPVEENDDYPREKTAQLRGIEHFC